MLCFTRSRVRQSGCGCTENEAEKRRKSSSQLLRTVRLKQTFLVEGNNRVGSYMNEVVNLNSTSVVRVSLVGVFRNR